MNRKPVSMTQLLVKAGVMTVLGTALCGAAFFISSQRAMESWPTGPTDGSQSVMDNRPTAKGSPNDLLAKHGCWTGEAPKGVTVPGHVVVRYDGDVAARYLGAKAVSDALNHIFDAGKPDHGVVEVYGFCR